MVIESRVSSSISGLHWDLDEVNRARQRCSKNAARIVGGDERDPSSSSASLVGQPSRKKF